MKQKQDKLQTQAVEALGRGLFVSRLIREQIGVALPLWDDGVDLVAHLYDGDTFRAKPIQLKVSTNTYLGIEAKYEKNSELLMVFIWLNTEIEKSRILYALFSTHGHLATPSWINDRSYSTRTASRAKIEYLQDYEVGTKSLRELLFPA
jgi:hypothetical protein